MNFRNIKSPRAWIISDIHFGARNNNVQWLEIVKSYFYDFFIPQVKPNKKDGDILIMNGDLFDNRQSLNILVLNEVIFLFEKLSELFPNGIIVNTGNHDIYRKTSNEISSLIILKYLPNVHVIKQPTEIEVGNNKVMVMAWQYDSNAEKSIVEKTKADYIFVHQDIKGLYYDKKRIIDDGVSITQYAKFKRVYAGHIHYAQSKDNITLTGNPYQLTRSDRGNQKGIYIIDFDKNEETFIENTFSPKFVILYLDKIIEWKIGKLEELIKNNFVDIYVPSKYISKYSVNDLINYLSEMARTIEVIPYEEETKTYDDVDMEYAENLNILDLCKKYITDSQSDDDIKTRMHSKIEELYKRVQKDDYASDEINEEL